MVGRQFGVADNTAGLITRGVCHAICKHVVKDFIKPSYGARLAGGVEGFTKKGFPLCAGAVDGCHIPIAAPRWTEVKEAYHNRKQFHSIQLQVRPPDRLRS